MTLIIVSIKSFTVCIPSFLLPLFIAHGWKLAGVLYWHRHWHWYWF